jgi:hypothetical protein
MAATHRVSTRGFPWAPAPLVAATVLMAALVSAHFAIGGGWREAWHALGSSSMSPGFADLRTITHSLDAVRAGVDPYVETRFDPWHRTFNYPRAWLWLAPLGLGAGSTMVLGLAMAAMLFATLAVLFRPRQPITWLATLGFSLSPPVLLGIERGNSDILIFALLVFGIMASRTSGDVTNNSVQPLARTALIAMLTMLKIFPLAAIVVLVSSRRSLVVAAGAAVVALACLWLSLQSGDMARILGNTPQSTFNAFGGLPLVQAVADAIGQPATMSVRPFATGLALLVAAAAAVAAVLLPEPLHRLLPRLTAGHSVDDVALACLGIHLLAFLPGSSWDYRLIFLIGTVPPMLAAYDRERRSMFLALPILVGIFVWAGPLSPYIHAGEEVLDWVIFALAAGWLAATLAARLGIGMGISTVVPARPIGLPVPARHDSGAT